MGDNLIYAVRGSPGFSLQRGVATPTTILQKDLDPKDFHCRSFKFSNNGNYFAYCDSQRTVVVESSTGKELFAEDLPKTAHILFSPRDRVMVTFEPFVIYGTRFNDDGTEKKPAPNLRFWSIGERRLLCTLTAKKQSDWRPQFSDDERLAVRQFNSELHFHQNLDFEKFAFKGVVKDVGAFVLSPGAEPVLACFIPPIKGQPALIQLRQCNKDVTMISQKMSFNADHCTMTWNSKGSHVLVTATADVDKSDKSYYGVSHLYVLSAQGDSFQVPLDKEGPLHAVQWNPTGREFCVCYGFMPSKISVFNLRGDVVWNLGPGHRNEVHYNRFGTLLLTCGFGNISKGHMQFWSVEEKREVISIEVPNTTLFEWAPDGQHFLTATTAPRLRIDNVYRIWHYSGRLIREVPFDKQELWQVTWKPVPNDAYCKFKVAELTAEEKAKSGLLIKPKGDNSQLSAMPAGSINQKGAYVPPHLRNKNNSQKGALQKPEDPNAPPKPQVSETERKLKKVQKTLEDIAKLRLRREQGEPLEVNQLAKIDKEQELLAELQQLILEENGAAS